MRNTKKLSAILLAACIGLSTFAGTALAAEKTTVTTSALATQTTKKAENNTIPIDASHFPDAKFRKVLKKEYGESVNPKEVTSLWLNGEKIKSVKGIEYFTNLEMLDCMKNRLSSLDLRNNKKLTSLDCSGNQIKKLNVSKNTKLDYLDCSKNKLKTLNISKNKKLVVLVCNYNKIKTLNTGNNKNLQNLFIYSNKIKTINLKKNKKIQFMDCDKNVKIKGRKVPNIWRGKKFPGF